MTKNQNFFKSTKYLWIGGVLGILQQILGLLRSVDPIFQNYDITNIMGGLTFWAAFILLLLLRKKPTAKEHFRDIFLLFVGLDFFYYFYLIFVDIYEYFTYFQRLPEDKKKGYTIFQNTLEEIPDFFKWTAIGLAAAILGYIAIRSRDKGRKKLYIALLLPFFAFFALYICDDAVYTVNYIKQELTPVDERPVGMYCIFSPVLNLFDLIAAAVCVFLYARYKPWNYPPRHDAVSSDQ